MEFSYEGIGQIAATFAMEEGLDPGMVVAMTGNFTVGKGESGNVPCGVVLGVEGDCCAVQVGGFAEVPYVGDAPAVGMNVLTVDGSGAVQKSGTTGLNCLVIQVNKPDKTAIIKL